MQKNVVFPLPSNSQSGLPVNGWLKKGFNIAAFGGVGAVASLSIKTAGIAILGSSFAPAVASAAAAGIGAGVARFAIQRVVDKRAGRDVHAWSDLWRNRSVRNKILMGTAIATVTGGAAFMFADQISAAGQAIREHINLGGLFKSAAAAPVQSAPPPADAVAAPVADIPHPDTPADKFSSSAVVEAEAAKTVRTVAQAFPDQGTENAETPKLSVSVLPGDSEPAAHATHEPPSAARAQEFTEPSQPDTLAPAAEASLEDRVSNFLAAHNPSKKITTTMKGMLKGRAQDIKDMAFFLFNGREGLVQNQELAVELYRKAAALNNSQAKVDLAYIEAHGLAGVTKDRSAAIMKMKELATHNPLARSLYNAWTNASTPPVAASLPAEPSAEAMTVSCRPDGQGATCFFKGKAARFLGNIGSTFTTTLPRGMVMGR